MIKHSKAISAARMLLQRWLDMGVYHVEVIGDCRAACFPDGSVRIYNSKGEAISSSLGAEGIVDDMKALTAFMEAHQPSAPSIAEPEPHANFNPDRSDQPQA